MTSFSFKFIIQVCHWYSFVLVLLTSCSTWSFQQLCCLHLTFPLYYLTLREIPLKIQPLSNLSSSKGLRTRQYYDEGVIWAEKWTGFQTFLIQVFQQLLQSELPEFIKPPNKWLFFFCNFMSCIPVSIICVMINFIIQNWMHPFFDIHHLER